MIQICEIPYDKASAVDNMATDSAMLEFGHEMEQVMWRLYGWEEPAITFGYSQRWEWVQSTMGNFDGPCIRRITGGGIVDHRHDLTYSLSLPPGHPFYRKPATNLYSGLHEQIAAILLDMGFSAGLAPCGESCGEVSPSEPAGICFQAPEPFDVVQVPSGIKLAGAAMKRGQMGVLIQGSLSMNHLPGLSRTTFGDEFGRRLSRWLGGECAKFTGILPLPILLQERKRFSSIEWNQKR